MERKQVDKVKDKLNSFINIQITTMFSGILDFTEVAVGDKERHKALRSKVLKLSNDTIREIQKEINERYRVEYDSPTQEVIVIKHS